MISSSFYKRLCCLRHGFPHRFPHPMTEDQTMKLLFEFVLGREDCFWQAGKHDSAFPTLAIFPGNSTSSF